MLSMDLDLNNLLDEWPHEAGKIKVRRIAGRDGREKVQLRLDLGLIQMEMDGRPDGLKPYGHESLLDHHREMADEAGERGEPYTLSQEACAELQQEGVQYYHRYISLFQLEDYDGVIRDTQRNLALFEFVADHCDREDIVWSFTQFRPYVTMMLTRARCNRALEQNDFEIAIREVKRGIQQIEKIYAGSPQPELVASSSELAFLNNWLEEIREQRPVSQLERLERQLEEAIASEAYEQAAALRDEIRGLNTQA